MVLRCLAASDDEGMFTYRSDPSVLRFQSWEKPKSIAVTKQFISANAIRDFNTAGWYQVAIGLREADGRIIGDCGIHVLECDDRIVEFGITLSPGFQGLGYATEALKSVINFHFVNLGKYRIFTSVDPCNKSSMALMDRVGMRKEAHFVQSVCFKGSWVDEVIFAVLASEWTPLPCSYKATQRGLSYFENKS